jgi:hypothetical protein
MDDDDEEEEEEEEEEEFVQFLKGQRSVHVVQRATRAGRPIAKTTRQIKSDSAILMSCLGYF